jgi:hypothetical protein
MEEVKKAEIISNLKSDDKYYGQYGKQFLSNSDIGTLISNPKAYLEPKEDNINLMYGRAFHELIMFGNTKYDNFVDASTRTTKIYKESVEEYGSMLFLKKEWDELNKLVENALKNSLVNDIISNKKNQYEVPNLSTMGNDDILWKCKADIVSEEYIIDIKTSSSIGGFRYSSKSYNYDSQAYIYSTMFQKPMKFLVVEKVTGCIGFFDVTDEAYLNGQEKVRLAEENYLKYFVNKSEELKDFTIYGEI